jgi:hypothetical protein
MAMFGLSSSELNILGHRRSIERGRLHGNKSGYLVNLD